MVASPASWWASLREQQRVVRGRAGAVHANPPHRSARLGQVGASSRFSTGGAVDRRPRGALRSGQGRWGGTSWSANRTRRLGRECRARSPPPGLSPGPHQKPRGLGGDTRILLTSKGRLREFKYNLPRITQARNSSPDQPDLKSHLQFLSSRTLAPSLSFLICEMGTVSK